MVRTNTSLNSQATAIKKLEVQIGQIANANATRPQGTLPNDNTIYNPKSSKAITTRSGLTLQDPQVKNQPMEDEVVNGEVDQERVINREV